MNQTQNALDDVLDALNVANIPQKQKQEIVVKNVEEYDEASILDKTLKGLTALKESNDVVLEEARRLVETTGDVDYFNAYTMASKAQSETYKNIIKILVDKEKNKVTKDTKNREIDVKEKLVDFQISNGAGLGSGATLNQTNVIMTGTREEALDMIKRMKLAEKEEKEKNVIEV